MRCRCGREIKEWPYTLSDMNVLITPRIKICCHCLLDKVDRYITEKKLLLEDVPRPRRFI